MHYVNKRWLGGLLTNFPMVKKSIDKLLELDEMKRDGRWDVKSKKEQSGSKKYTRNCTRTSGESGTWDRFPGRSS